MILKKLFYQPQFVNVVRTISYIQGQSPEPKVREYFYFIDHQGMVNIKQSFNTFYEIFRSSFIVHVRNVFFELVR